MVGIWNRNILAARRAMRGDELGGETAVTVGDWGGVAEENVKKGRDDEDEVDQG